MQLNVQRRNSDGPGRVVDVTTVVRLRIYFSSRAIELGDGLNVELGGHSNSQGRLLGFSPEN